ncbi:1942_t:CDS:1 [Paraglomus brasilianum]|uniref:1942_t:CDS:1 n=1 Tax=Paraglomus brasilianum TaxID=144538 RepID=A0A9N9G8P4_9GLOM|nr:1942_t:CDS:1 [Paraglomus brasilianum]
MKQNAIRTIFFLVCCLLVVLSPSLAATVKRADGDIGYAEFRATGDRPVSGAVTFYQSGADIIIYGQFNTGIIVGFPPCTLKVKSNPEVSLTALIPAGTKNQPFRFTLKGKSLQSFKGAKLVLKCDGGLKVGSTVITVIP